MIHKLAKSGRKLFLIDGLGALLTAFCLALVLAPFESTFGMPRNILYILAIVACLLAVYSLCCYFFLSTNPRIFLKGIAIANTLYCCTTLLLVFVHSEHLTILGISYFLLELIVVFFLIAVELLAAYGKNEAH